MRVCCALLVIYSDQVFNDRSFLGCKFFPFFSIANLPSHPNQRHALMLFIVSFYFDHHQPSIEIYLFVPRKQPPTNQSSIHHCVLLQAFEILLLLLLLWFVPPLLHTGSVRPRKRCIHSTDRSKIKWSDWNCALLSVPSSSVNSNDEAADKVWSACLSAYKIHTRERNSQVKA